MSKLRIRNGPYNGREKTLAEKPVTIGRDVEADIQILDRSASRFHAEVFPVGGMYFVRDLESKNGTFVNSDQLDDEELLREGDVIKIGTTELVYETGVAVTDEESSDRVSYSDDASLLSNTLEFRVDDLSDIEDEDDNDQGDDARTLQMLYQVGKFIGAGNDPTLVSRILDYLVATIPAESALIFMRDRSSGRLLPHTVRTADTSAHPVITRTLIRRAMLENRAVLTANAQEDDRFDRRDSAVLKGIGSVVCVPLGIGGQARGVLYLSRRPGDEAFLQRDLELLSACAVQLGLAFQSLEQHRRNRRTLWTTLLAMVRLIESRLGRLGAGERCARTAAALARSLSLPKASIERLRLAGLLHHINSFPSNGVSDIEQDLACLGALEELEDVVPLIRTCSKRLDQNRRATDGEGASDAEERILLVAITFLSLIETHPEADAVQLIERMREDQNLDETVLTKLQACHLDGTLYAPDKEV